ncbi:MAG: hypothetical protein ACJ8HQ_08905 [Chthoniobacterales bacterium]
MTNDPAIPPPPRAGAGCLGVGCMTFLAFFIFLLVVAIGGGAWGILHLRKNYSSTEPLPIPEVATTDDSTVSPPPPVPSPDGTTVPAIPPSRTVQADQTEQRWKEFEKAARHNEAKRIEMTAGEINALIAKGRNTRGKAFVTIQNNVGHVTVSAPLDGVMFMSGRYLNGEATIKASPDGDPGKLQITNVTIGNESVPDDFLDRRIFGWNSIRGYVQEWLNQHNIVSFRIENDRAIGETGG